MKQLYIGATAFLLVSVVLYLCLPMSDRVIAYLEGLSRQDGPPRHKG